MTDQKFEAITNKKLQFDAFTFLPGLPDACVDLIITDPPYDFNDTEKIVLHAEFLRVCKNWVIVFSPPENQWIQPAEQYLFWIKPISTKNTILSYSRFIEMIFVYGSGIWNIGRHWSQYTNIFTDLVDNKDPYRKPPSLIERLILNHSRPGDIILDPFAGSFVVAEVATKLSRNYICSDIEVNHV